MKVTREKIFRRFNRVIHEIASRVSPLKRDNSSIPAVSYARQAPRPGEVATGGRVKLIALAEVFPEQTRANILYLVSSALPSNYRYWINRAIHKKIPIVLNQNGVATPGWAGEKTDEINAPLKWTLERANTVIYQSEFCKRSADRFLGFAKGPTFIAYNAVNLAQFSPEPRPPGRPLTILLGGSQYQRYRVTSALEAFALVAKSIPEAKLLISGKIDWQNDPALSTREVLELACQLKIENQVQLTGPFLQSEAPALYRQADILLHTKYNDPCPTAVIEALACGLGVVHSMSGGLPELVDPSCGVGLPVVQSYETDHSPSAEVWAGALISTAERLSDIRISARKVAEAQFGMDHWLKVHRSVFGDLTSQCITNPRS